MYEDLDKVRLGKESIADLEKLIDGAEHGNAEHVVELRNNLVSGLDDPGFVIIIGKFVLERSKIAVQMLISRN